MGKLDKFFGLKGGPNYKPFSTEGYKSDSPDRFNDFNIIPSGDITMKGVNHPVYGEDELGNGQMMFPGNDYQFPGDEVIEVPINNEPTAEQIANDPELEGWDKYNTELTPEEEVSYKEWAIKANINPWDRGAYDSRGYWKDFIASGKGDIADSDGHRPDTYKKPNHPTFSNQSKYHGVDGNYGGVWTDDAGFQPSKQTLERYGEDYYTRPETGQFTREPNRPEHLDLSRFISGENQPTPLVYQTGGEYEEQELTDAEIATLRAQGYEVEELPVAQEGHIQGISKDSKEFKNYIAKQKLYKLSEGIRKDENISKAQFKKFKTEDGWSDNYFPETGETINFNPDFEYFEPYLTEVSNLKGKRKHVPSGYLKIKHGDDYVWVAQYDKPDPVFLEGSKELEYANKQLELKDKGLYSGAIDGIWGDKSEEAWNTLNKKADVERTPVAKNLVKEEKSKLPEGWRVKHHGSRDGSKYDYEQYDEATGSWKVKHRGDENWRPEESNKLKPRFEFPSQKFKAFSSEGPSNTERAVELELTDEEIAEYRLGGYIVEELPKAQAGLNLELLNNALQIGQHEQNKDFLTSMVDSPLFGDRYKAMSGNPDLTDVEIAEYQNSIRNNIDTAKLLNFIPTEDTGGFYRPPVEKNLKNRLQDVIAEGPDRVGGIDWAQDMINQEHTINIPFGKDYSASVDQHETSHSSTQGPHDLRVKDEPIAEMYPGFIKSLNEKAEGYSDYLQEPTEQKARVDVLRKFMLDNNIYDATKDVFTDEHYNKVQEYLNNNTDVIEEQDSELSTQLRQILDYYSPEDVETLMNSFVQNETENEGLLPTAQKGGVKVRTESGDVVEMDPASEEYAAMQSKLMSTTNQSNDPDLEAMYSKTLPEFNVTARPKGAEDYKYWDYLDPKEKEELLHPRKETGLGSHHRYLRDKANYGYGLKNNPDWDAKDALVIPSLVTESLSSVGRTLSAPQALMVEHAYNQAGLPFDYSNANPFVYSDKDKQRRPSSMMGDYEDTGWGMAADILLDPLNAIPGAGAASKMSKFVTPSAQITKNLLRSPASQKAFTQQLSKLASKVPTYDKLAHGETMVPYAWKSRAVGLDPTDKKLFDAIKNTDELSDISNAVVGDYATNSSKYTGRNIYGKYDGQPIVSTHEDAQRTALNNIIKNSNTEIPENTILTRMFNPDNPQINNLNLDVNRPTSWTTGARGSYGSGATDRFVLSGRNAQQMEGNIFKNQYNSIGEEGRKFLHDKFGLDYKAMEKYMSNPSIMNRGVEREVLTSGTGFKTIGKVKNDVGGYDHIMKPVRQKNVSNDVNSGVDNIASNSNIESSNLKDNIKKTHGNNVNINTIVKKDHSPQRDFTMNHVKSFQERVGTLQGQDRLKRLIKEDMRFDGPYTDDVANSLGTLVYEQPIMKDLIKREATLAELGLPESHPDILKVKSQIDKMENHYFKSKSLINKAVDNVAKDFTDRINKLKWAGDNQKMVDIYQMEARHKNNAFMGPVADDPSNLRNRIYLSKGLFKKPSGLPVQTVEHELAHLSQQLSKFNQTERGSIFDRYLQQKMDLKDVSGDEWFLNLKDNYGISSDLGWFSDPDYLKKAKTYFTKGQGLNPSPGDASRITEASPFVSEVRAQLVRQGKIDDYYSPISDDVLKSFYKDYHNTPLHQKSPLRIFDIMEPTEKSFSAMNKVINNLLGISPLVGMAGAAAAAATSGKPGSPLPKNQLGGAYEDMELTDMEIAMLRAQGQIVEEL